MKIEKQYKGEDQWRESSLEDIAYYWAEGNKSEEEVKQIIIDNHGCLVGGFAVWRIKNGK